MIQPDKNKVLKILNAKFGNVQRVDNGNGGNSWVYKFKHKEEEFCAIKVLRRFDRYLRFKEEVSIARTLSSEKGICQLLEFNLPETPDDKSYLGLPYFTMPFYPNGSLESRITSPASDAGLNALSVFKQIASIIAKIHSKNFAHRDLKPENILIISDSELCISDFGLCLDLTKEAVRLTQQEEIVGSFYYRAPEYLRGKLDTSDHRPGDIFSLGRILWSLIAGKQPIGYSDWEFSQKKVSAFVPDLRKGYLIDELIMNCTYVDPTRRPSIEDVLQVIAEWEHEPQANSIGAVKTKILDSSELLIMRNNQKTWGDLMNTWNELVSFTQNTLQNHTVFSQMNDLFQSAFPERSMNIGVSSAWRNEVIDTVLTKPEKVVTFEFNLGNIQLAPLLIANFNFVVEAAEMKILFEVAACSIDKNEKKELWSLKPIEFHDFDSKSMVTIEQHINSAMQEVNDWLIKSRVN